MMPLYEQNDFWFKSDFPFCLRIDTLTYNILPHGHNFIEFNYTLEGHGTEKINGVPHELKPGTFTLLFPHQIHELLPDPGNNIRMYVGGFGLEYLFDVNETILPISGLLYDAQYTAESYYYLDDNTCCKITSVLSQMLFEIGTALVWSRSMFKIKLAELLILFDRYRTTTGNNPKKNSNSNRKQNFIDIIQYVFKNFHDNITLETLSEKFYLSIPYISSSFKQNIGENFHDFLEKLRIAHACSLLGSTDLSVIDISYEAGFKSYKTFSRVFLAQIKMTPTKYRSQIILAKNNVNGTVQE